ncbi:Salicylic acid-binding protein 2 [Melia azedarach]|uniref:Salicylic acid-binding protein 2 n=1 Tax=Melia azedarach TaxID=155640 RepID=A0ACC1XUW4_MELAZ|nr:Salicylic acid-binding protein 2 [Melia azedarach]
MDFMSSLSPDKKVILVGHSYGGICMSLAMENFPEKILVGVFVCICASLQVSTWSCHTRIFGQDPQRKSLLDCKLEFDQGLENPPTSGFFGPEYLESMVYNNCQLEDVELAIMLVRTNKAVL